MTRKTVVVTGASGLLGRAVVQTLNTGKNDVIVIPLALTRAAVDPAYTKLDLLDSTAVSGFFSNHRVDVVIHCAAERRPDVAEADPEKAARINVAVPAQLAQLAREHTFTLIYISTDYVFNGTKPPYEVDDDPDPLNSYGKQKREGEVAVLAEREHGANITVLRVPLLYGWTEYNAESAVNVIVDLIQDRSGKQYKMDHLQVRYPTNVSDIARVLQDLIELPSLPPILHYASPAPAMTKYEMTQVIGRQLGLSIDHIASNTVKPQGTQRPENSQLSNKKLEELGVNVNEEKSFEEWWKGYVTEMRETATAQA